MSNKVLLILIGLVLVLVLVMGGGMFMIWTKLSPASPKEVVSETEAESIPEKASFENLWPKELQARVLKNWESYGFAAARGK
jgi:flagellar basal body-associated protein FliL